MISYSMDLYVVCFVPIDFFYLSVSVTIDVGGLQIYTCLVRGSHLKQRIFASTK